MTAQKQHIQFAEELMRFLKGRIDVSIHGRCDPDYDIVFDFDTLDIEELAAKYFPCSSPTLDSTKKEK